MLSVTVQLTSRVRSDEAVEMNIPPPQLVAVFPETVTPVRVDSALVEITQKGKECHNKCAIYYLAGDCIMPREGIFGRVLKGGEVCCGAPVRILWD